METRNKYCCCCKKTQKHTVSSNGRNELFTCTICQSVVVMPESKPDSATSFVIRPVPHFSSLF